MTDLSFGEKDRQRWGLDEFVPVHPLDISVVDLVELSDRFGFDVADWPEVLFGEIPFEQAGSPDAKPVPPKWQNQAMVWMALRQNGVAASWDEAGEARVGWLRWRTESPGKEPPTTSTPSDESEASTTPRSGKSSTSPKKR